MVNLLNLSFDTIDVVRSENCFCSEWDLSKIKIKNE
jgi:hypothetical protein